MLLTVHMLLESADTGSLPDRVPWTSIQTPVFILQGLFCVAAALWAVRARTRDGRRAAVDSARQLRRFTRLVVEHQDRTLSALWVELERTRMTYDRASEREWTMAQAEVRKAYERVAARVEVAEKRFGEERERATSGFNEALVVIQQAGMAAARIVAHKSGPKGRQRF